MKVTVVLADLKVVVPCGTGDNSIRHLRNEAFSRIKRAGFPEQHKLDCEERLSLRLLDGAVLDLDDRVIDVLDNNDKVLAVFHTFTNDVLESSDDNNVDILCDNVNDSINSYGHDINKSNSNEISINPFPNKDVNNNYTINNNNNNNKYDLNHALIYNNNLNNQVTPEKTLDSINQLNSNNNTNLTINNNRAINTATTNLVRSQSMLTDKLDSSIVGMDGRIFDEGKDEFLVMVTKEDFLKKSDLKMKTSSHPDLINMYNNNNSKKQSNNKNNSKNKHNFNNNHDLSITKYLIPDFEENSNNTSNPTKNQNNSTSVLNEIEYNYETSNSNINTNADYSHEINANEINKSCEHQCHQTSYVDSDDGEDEEENRRSILNERNVETITLKTDFQAIGIHVKPVFNGNEDITGLEVRSVDGTRVAGKDGRLCVGDHVIEVNNISLYKIDLGMAQNIFKTALERSEIQLKVIKVQHLNSRKPAYKSMVDLKTREEFDATSLSAFNPAFTTKSVSLNDLTDECYHDQDFDGDELDDRGDEGNGGYKNNYNYCNVESEEYEEEENGGVNYGHSNECNYNINENNFEMYYFNGISHRKSNDNKGKFNLNKNLHANDLSHNYIINKNLIRSDSLNKAIDKSIDVQNDDDIIDVDGDCGDNMASVNHNQEKYAPNLKNNDGLEEIKDFSGLESYKGNEKHSKFEKKESKMSWWSRFKRNKNKKNKDKDIKKKKYVETKEQFSQTDKSSFKRPGYFISNTNNNNNYDNKKIKEINFENTILNKDSKNYYEEKKNHVLGSFSNDSNKTNFNKIEQKTNHENQKNITSNQLNNTRINEELANGQIMISPNNSNNKTMFLENTENKNLNNLNDNNGIINVSSIEYNESNNKKIDKINTNISLCVNQEKNNHEARKKVFKNKNHNSYAKFISAQNQMQEKQRKFIRNNNTSIHSLHTSLDNDLELENHMKDNKFNEDLGEMYSVVSSNKKQQNNKEKTEKVWRNEINEKKIHAKRNNQKDNYEVNEHQIIPTYETIVQNISESENKIKAANDLGNEFFRKQFTENNDRFETKNVENSMDLIDKNRVDYKREIVHKNTGGYGRLDNKSSKVLKDENKTSKGEIEKMGASDVCKDSRIFVLPQNKSVLSELNKKLQKDKMFEAKNTNKDLDLQNRNSCFFQPQTKQQKDFQSRNYNDVAISAPNNSNIMSFKGGKEDDNNFPYQQNLANKFNNHIQKNLGRPHENSINPSIKQIDLTNLKVLKHQSQLKQQKDNKEKGKFEKQNIQQINDQPMDNKILIGERYITSNNIDNTEQQFQEYNNNIHSRTLSSPIRNANNDISFRPNTSCTVNNNFHSNDVTNKTQKENLFGNSRFNNKSNLINQTHRSKSTYNIPCESSRHKEFSYRSNLTYKLDNKITLSDKLDLKEKLHKTGSNDSSNTKNGNYNLGNNKINHYSKQNIMAKSISSYNVSKGVVGKNQNQTETKERLNLEGSLHLQHKEPFYFNPLLHNMNSHQNHQYNQVYPCEQHQTTFNLSENNKNEAFRQKEIRSNIARNGFPFAKQNNLQNNQLFHSTNLSNNQNDIYQHQNFLQRQQYILQEHQQHNHQNLTQSQSAHQDPSKTSILIQQTTQQIEKTKHQILILQQQQQKLLSNQQKQPLFNKTSATFSQQRAQF